MNKWLLVVGETYLWRDSHVKVQRFLDQNLVLLDEHGATQIVSIAEFVRDRATPVEKDINFAPEPLLEGVATKKAIESARKMQRHLEIAINGFDVMLEDQPVNQAFDPETTNLTQRMKAKAAELGIQLSALWKIKKRYEDAGLVGLIDGRMMRTRRAVRLKSQDPLYQTIKTVLEGTAEESKLSRKILISRVKTKLEKGQGNRVKLPSLSTLNRLITAIEQELGLQGSARQRQKRQLEPRAPFGQFRATRPGHTILIDSTILDAFCVDPKTMNWTRVALVIAFDVYSRSIVAWRFMPESTKGTDAALLMFDILHPKPALPDWPDVAKWRYFGVPEELWVIQRKTDETDQDLESERVIAGIPFVKPQTIVIDHDKVFISKVLQHVCVMLGTNIQRARIRRPTDKSMVENVFGYINENFAARLPGYKGADVPSRGINVEEKAYYFIDEVDAMFAEWVATDWQNHVSRTLIFPGAPTVRMSPNEAYAEGIIKAGVLPIPNLSYFDCLETEYRRIDKNGVIIDYLTYDSPDLNIYRDVKSKIISGPHKGKYPIKVDPRDRSQVYFYDEYSEDWLSIPWRGTRIFPKPFSDVSLAFAKARVLERFHTVAPDDGDFAQALKEMYARWDEDRFVDGREKRAYGRSETLTKQAANDRKKTKAKTIPAKPMFEPEEEMVEEIAMPPKLRGRVERFDESRRRYEKTQAGGIISEEESVTDET